MVASFEHDDLQPGKRKVAGAHQTVVTATDDDYIARSRVGSLAVA